MQKETIQYNDHPFVKKPHRTLVTMSLPVLLSLIVEPLTGLADTAFVSRLGTTPLAALGVGTIVLSSLFWAFNFLNIGSQTEVAQAFGRKDTDTVRQVASSALTLSAIIAGIVVLLVYAFVNPIVQAMGAEGAVLQQAVTYTRIRMFGGPAILITMAAFGVCRGLQDMKTPLYVAALVNILNCILDPLMIFGLLGFPEMGIVGAAIATVVSQWIGAIIVLIVLVKRLSLSMNFQWHQCKNFLNIGRDLFIRTGLLTLFLALTTRSATAMGAEYGAAHQAIRQFWVFTAYLLDSFGITGQSLVGYFLGALAIKHARAVAKHVCLWSCLIGLVLTIFMLACTRWIIALLVPAGAVVVFVPAWYMAALLQPLFALAFATDGIHWGTGDFAFLRNVVILATALSTAILFLNPVSSLAMVWCILGVWAAVRGLFGLLRVWPGIGKSPLAIEVKYS